MQPSHDKRFTLLQASFIQKQCSVSRTRDSVAVTKRSTRALISFLQRRQVARAHAEAAKVRRMEACGGGSRGGKTASRAGSSRKRTTSQRRQSGVSKRDTEQESKGESDGHQRQSSSSSPNEGSVRLSSPKNAATRSPSPHCVPKEALENGTCLKKHYRKIFLGVKERIVKGSYAFHLDRYWETLPPNKLSEMMEESS